MATIPLVLLRTNEQRGIGNIVNEAAVAALIARPNRTKKQTDMFYEAMVTNGLDHVVIRQALWT